MKIETIVSAPFDENTYIAHWGDREDCIVVDPGFDVRAIVSYLDRHRLTPAAILNTHGHADHIVGNGPLKQRWPDCPLVIGRGDAGMLVDPVANLSKPFGMALTSPPADVLLDVSRDEGAHYSAAGMDFIVHEIPGHSPGHIVFVLRPKVDGADDGEAGASDGGAAGSQSDVLPPTIVFGGDVLFAGSIGRTDFPGGSFEQLAEGIHRHLFTLPDDTLVYSGHGPMTTIGRERRSNPYVGERALRSG